MDIIQLSGSFVSIVLLSLLVYWLFPKPDVLSAKAATDEFERYAPDFNVSKTYASNDGLAVLLTAQHGSMVGLVAALGDKLCCRMIDMSVSSNWSRRGNNQLIINCHDFTYPPVRLELDSSQLDEFLSPYVDGAVQRA